VDELLWAWAIAPKIKKKKKKKVFVFWIGLLKRFFFYMSGLVSEPELPWIQLE